MARKFMTIKRIVIPFISLVILTSQLTGCATLSSKEMLEELANGDEVVIEYQELNTSTTSSDTVEINGITYEYVEGISEDGKTINLVEINNREYTFKKDGNLIKLSEELTTEERNNVQKLDKIRNKDELDSKITSINAESEVEYVYLVSSAMLRSAPSTECNVYISLPAMTVLIRRGPANVEGWSMVSHLGKIYYVEDSALNIFQTYNQHNADQMEEVVEVETEAPVQQAPTQPSSSGNSSGNTGNSGSGGNGNSGNGSTSSTGNNGSPSVEDVFEALKNAGVQGGNRDTGPLIGKEIPEGTPEMTDRDWERLSEEINMY